MNITTNKVRNYCNFEDIYKSTLHKNMHIHIVKCSSQCAQLQLPQLLLLYVLNKKDNKQAFIHMEMLDGSLLFEELTKKWTKNTQKCSQQR